MSEDNTHATRQIFHVLQIEQLISTTMHEWTQLDLDLLDEEAGDNLRRVLLSAAEYAEQLVRSTRKLLD